MNTMDRNEWLSHFWGCVSNGAALSFGVKRDLFDGLLLKKDTEIGKRLDEHLVRCDCVPADEDQADFCTEITIQWHR